MSRLGLEGFHCQPEKPEGYGIISLCLPRLKIFLYPGGPSSGCLQVTLAVGNSGVSKPDSVLRD